MQDFKVRAVMCGGCGHPIPVTRRQEADRCDNPHCPAPDRLDRRRLLELWELERAAKYTPALNLHGLEATKDCHPARLGGNGNGINLGWRTSGRTIVEQTGRRQM